MAELTRTNNEIASAKVQARIRQAISNMPYGGLVHPNYPRDERGRAADLDLEWLAGYLEQLRVVLETYSASNQEDEKELRELRSTQYAIRKFLGLVEDLVEEKTETVTVVVPKKRRRSK